MTYDLGAAMANFALPLPAVNDGYNHFTTRTMAARQVGLRPRDLNFLDPASPLIHYPHCLYSADFARRDGTKMGMVGGRDRQRTTAFIDSGGFGFISGAIAIHDIVDLRREALVAQERLGDAGVIVDVPTACAAKKTKGAETVKKCLALTQDSIEYAIKHRDPLRPLKLLNMIQGLSAADCRMWYEGVRAAPLDGFGFAGARRKDISLVLELIVMMIRDDRINGRSWFHVFGTNHPGVGIFLTAIQRQLRLLLCSDETRISYDSSTSFRYVAQYGIITTGLVADGKRVGLANYKTAASGYSIPADAPWPWRSEIGRGRAVGDFLPMTRSGSGGVDELGGHMMSNHGLDVELNALVQANRLFDMEHGDDWKMRQGRAFPYQVHAGVDRIGEVFDRVRAGDYKGAIGHAQAERSSLGMFGGVDPGEEER